MHVDFLRHSFCTGFGQRKDIQENRSRVSSSSVDAGTAFDAQDRGAIRCPEAQEPSISALVDPVPITSDQQATSTCLCQQQGGRGSSTSLHFVRIILNWHPVFSSACYSSWLGAIYRRLLFLAPQSLFKTFYRWVLGRSLQIPAEITWQKLEISNYSLA